MKIAIYFALILSLNAENLNYKQARVKAKSQSSHPCYIYVDVNGNKDWDYYKQELNTVLDEKNRCKKVTIYKIIKNVHTTRRGYIPKLDDSKNSSSDEFYINLGVIIKNSNANVEVITVVKNSKIGGGVKEKKANTGIVTSKDEFGEIDAENKKYKSTTQIENSRVGTKNILIQYGLEKGIDMLSDDKDNPFNN